MEPPAAAELRVLGALSVRGAGRGGLTGPRRLATLAYLVLARPRGLHARDTLLALFWPDSDLSSARHALRNVLHAIRSALGESAIVTEGDTLVGVSRSHVHCDQLTLESDLANDRVDAAIARYDGELLQGFHISGAPAFERWLDGERRRIRELVMSATLDLAAAKREQGDLTACLRVLRRAHTVDSENESVLRQLLDLMGELGEGAAALRLYSKFVAHLKDEYDSAPTPETRAVVSRLRGARPEADLRESAALDLYRRGTYLFLRGAPTGNVRDLESCRALFLKALDSDPQFAHAYAGLSNFYAVASVRGLLQPFDEHFRTALELSHRALALDPMLAVPHVHFGTNALYLECNWVDALMHFARASAIDPTYAEGHKFLAVVLEGIGQSELALLAYREAIRLEPHIALYRNALAAALMNNAQYEEAIDELRYALGLDHNYSAARDRLIRCYEKLHRYEDAVHERLQVPDAATAAAFATSLRTRGANGYRDCRAAELKEFITTVGARMLSGPSDSGAERMNPPQLRLALACAELGDWNRPNSGKITRVGRVPASGNGLWPILTSRRCTSRNASGTCTDLPTRGGPELQFSRGAWRWQTRGARLELHQKQSPGPFQPLMLELVIDSFATPPPNSAQLIGRARKTVENNLPNSCAE